MLGRAFLRSMSVFESVLFHAEVDTAAEELNISTFIMFQILEELETSLGTALIEWNGVVPTATKAGIVLQKAIEAGKIPMANAMVDLAEAAEFNEISMSCIEAFATFLSIPI